WRARSLGRPPSPELLAAARKRSEGDPPRGEVERQRLELPRERAEPRCPGREVGSWTRLVQRVLERPRRDPAAVDICRRRQLPGVSGRAQLSAEPELVARTHEVAERDAREPRQAAHLRPVLPHPDEELRGWPECLDDQRSREDRRAWEMVGEDVFCRADVLQRLDAAAWLDGNDAVNEDEAHSGSRGETRGGRELPHDVVAHRAHGEAVHEGLDRSGRVEILPEIVGEAVHGQIRQIERRIVEVGEHPLGERAHDLPLVAASAADAMLGGEMLENGSDGGGRHGYQLLRGYCDVVPCLGTLLRLVETMLPHQSVYVLPLGHCV